MKSKRILTMLLSLAIMLTFMPSMAFAATAGPTDEGHDFTILADKSNVEYTVEPTCTTPGIGVVTCTKSHGGVQCKATQNQAVPKLGHDPGDEITVTAAEFAAQMVKQGVKEADAKLWLDTAGKEICTGKVYPCKNCGIYFVKGGTSGKFYEATFERFYKNSKSIEHVAPKDTKECAATFDCINCGQKGVSNSTYNAQASATYHGIDLETGEWTWDNYFSPNEHFEVKTPQYKVHTNAEGHSVYAKVLECNQKCGLERKMATTGQDGDITHYQHPNTETVTVEPTCTTQGYTITVCKDCGYELGRQGTASLGHSWSEETVFPADEWDGELAYNVCTRCGEIDWDTEKEVSAHLDHNITATVIAPNSCSDCNWILVQCTNTLCKAEDQAILVNNDNKPTKKGSKYYVDFDGKDVEVPFAEATGHSWGDKQMIHEATCTAGAEEGITCTVCGAIKHNSVREISKPLGHDIEEVVVAPTCGAAGYSYKICNRCNNYLSQDGKEAKGKTLIDEVKYAPTNPVVKLGAKCTYEWKVLEEATPFKKGTRAKVCTVCNHLEEATKESIAEKKIAAPKVKAGKKKATVTVKAVEGAVKYQIKVNGKVKKTVTKAKKVTIKKLKGGKKAKFQIVAFNAEGVKAASKVKSVKIKK